MIVRLSEVPPKKRELAAWRLIRAEGLVGVAALELVLAAAEPREDPWLMVPSDLARKVLDDR